MSWAAKTIGELCDQSEGIVQTGPFGSQLKQAEYIDDISGVPVVMPKDIKEGMIDEAEIARISESKASALGRHMLDAGDIVFPRRGEISKRGYIKEGRKYFCGTGCLKIHMPDNEVLNKYLFYYLDQDHVVKWLEGRAIGSTMLNLNTSIMRSVKINFPDLNSQKRIVSALSAYDDLIENNKRRIELLEESARQLYKEWFVRFRFPGHEHVKIINGVPEGWSKTTYGEAAETVGGGTPSTKVPEYWEDGDVTWFVPKDLTNNNSLVLLGSEKKITKLGLQKSSAKMLPPNTIMMSSRASIGYFGLYDGDASTNQGFISVIPKQENTHMYLLHNLMSRKDEIIGLAGGTTYKEINKTTFRSIELLIPPDSLVDEFQDFASDLISQVRLLMKQIKHLTSARDILLPKLMNGEIAV